MCASRLARAPEMAAPLVFDPPLLDALYHVWDMLACTTERENVQVFGDFFLMSPSGFTELP